MYISNYQYQKKRSANLSETIFCEAVSANPMQQLGLLKDTFVTLKDIQCKRKSKLTIKIHLIEFKNPLKRFKQMNALIQFQ